MNYSICITTFAERFEMLKELIDSLRRFSQSNIILAVNGRANKKFCSKFRSKILSLCLDHSNIYPIFFPEQRGCSKLWNSLLVHSHTDWNLILNDDIKIHTDDFHNYTSKLKDAGSSFILINNSFSHFYIHKKIDKTVGFFDERFLGFGSEDGDYKFRLIDFYQKQLSTASVHGIENIIDDSFDSGILHNIGSKYTKFNSQFLHGNSWSKYINDPNGSTHGFPLNVSKAIEDLPQYCYEDFFRENINKLYK